MHSDTRTITDWSIESVRLFWRKVATTFNRQRAKKRHNDIICADKQGKCQSWLFIDCILSGTKIAASQWIRQKRCRNSTELTILSPTIPFKSNIKQNTNKCRPFFGEGNNVVVLFSLFLCWNRAFSPALIACHVLYIHAWKTFFKTKTCRWCKFVCFDCIYGDRQ